MEISVHSDCKTHNEIPNNNEYVNEEQRNEEEAAIFKLGKSREEKLCYWCSLVTSHHTFNNLMAMCRKTQLAS